MNRQGSRLKQAELASAVGAGVLGLGLGALLAAQVRPYLVATLVVGSLVHGWGMWDRHRLDTETETVTPRWAKALYWTCWIALAGLAVYLGRAFLSGR